MFFVTVSHADISLHIILIHPLDKIIYQMMKICRPVFSLFHGYV